MDKNSILLTLPIFAAPALLLIFALVSVVMPLSASTAETLSYVLLPLVEFGALYFFVLKKKMTLDLKTFVVTFLLGLVMIPLLMFAMYALFVPTLVPIDSIGTAGSMVAAFSAAIEWKSMIKNSTILGLMYIALLAGWFASQYLENRIYKILVFLVVGFVVLFILAVITMAIFNHF